jgi:hypothetical protein
MGGFKRRITTQDFRGGEITAIMGGCDLDLRQILDQWRGCAERVCHVRRHHHQGAGRLDGGTRRHADHGRLRREDHRTADPEKRLIVRGYAIMGGMEVRN